MTRTSLECGEHHRSGYGPHTQGVINPNHHAHSRVVSANVMHQNRSQAVGEPSSASFLRKVSINIPETVNDRAR